MCSVQLLVSRFSKSQLQIWSNFTLRWTFPTRFPCGVFICFEKHWPGRPSRIAMRIAWGNLAETRGHGRKSWTGSETSRLGGVGIDNFIVSTIFFLFFFIFISNISIITSSFIQTRTWETMVKEGYRILAFLYMRTRYAMLLLCMFASIMGCRGTLWKGNTSWDV